MREITGHRVPGAAGDVLRVRAMDGPGPGGANHRYVIDGYDPGRNGSFSTNMAPEVGDNRIGLPILFQNGAIGSTGVNGVTNEALLAIVADRLSCFQQGPFSCAENATALTHVLAALGTLKDRTQARIGRGVEGTHQV